MEHFIHLLPEALANQIAAGEVVQRPASVVKELLENAVDAKADKVDVWVRDAGKTLIQVTDNGRGMSVRDARMAFDRHATSKISSPEDLFRILTLGFRGEALASIAAVAQVRLRTRYRDAELGTEIDIEASEIKRQEATVMPQGSSFQVRNLFFNVPARRNFLKSNPVEMRHIINEFVHIALARQDIHLTLKHNDTEVYDLQPGSLGGRITAIYGEELGGMLLPIDESTGYVSIMGYTGKAEAQRKSRGDASFFVNGRYIRNNYLHHAVATAYQDFIPKGSHPYYCIFLEIDPVHVDINIHPTKSEVKFDDERTLYSLLHSTIKGSLGRWIQVPTPEVGDPELRRALDATHSGAGHQGIAQQLRPRETIRREDWEALYRRAETPATLAGTPGGQPSPTLFGSASAGGKSQGEAFFQQIFGKYILTEEDGQLYIIDQKRAHQRVLYERILDSGQRGDALSQQLLFPQTLEFKPADNQLLLEILEPLKRTGFDIRPLGPESYIVYGMPPEIAASEIRDLFDQIVDEVREAGGSSVETEIRERIARAVSLRSAVSSQQDLSVLEMKNLVLTLFRCKSPAFSPNGSPTWQVLNKSEIEELLS